jgi:hypothetical protein
MVRCVVIAMLIVYAIIAASFLSFYARYISSLALLDLL